MEKFAIQFNLIKSNLNFNLKFKFKIPFFLFLLVKTCGYPGSPAHATVTFSSDVIEADTVATYNCNNGYELLGPQRRTCNQNGTWTPQGVPFCGMCVNFFYFFIYYN